MYCLYILSFYGSYAFDRALFYLVLQWVYINNISQIRKEGGLKGGDKKNIGTFSLNTI